ncbi:MAG: 7-carboxy-7-deazaguanine synthase QueE [Gammaproteobacteria bacterium]
MSTSTLERQVSTQAGEGTKPGSVLRVTEIFYSLQGETNRVGLPTVFVRLTGCPLRCRYCDTAYAFHGGRNMALDEVLQEVMRYQARYVTVTGGEPLAQRWCPVLLRRLCDTGFAVSLETSGAVDVSAVDRRVMKVLDLKTPGSGETNRNRYANLRLLCEHDQVKFVICDRGDYDWAKETMTRFHLPECCEVLFSPASGYLAPALLAAWILADRLPVRFQIQLHKFLWGDVPGR